MGPTSSAESSIRLAKSACRKGTLRPTLEFVSICHIDMITMSFSRPLRAFLTLFFPCLLAVLPCTAQDTDPLLNPIFQDHVVVQRDTTVRVWGTAPPQDTVSVVMAGKAARTVASADGAWTADLPAMDAGGPHRLVARTSSGRVQIVDDVMVGDVYLCSGQSNMEFPVHRSLNSSAATSSPPNDRLRMLTVDHAHSATPKETLPTPVSWETASSETVGDWSAVCYYFANDLQQHVDVPIGLINSSWGGTSITAWMSQDALSSVGTYGDKLDLLQRYADDSEAAQHTFGEQWESWWREQSGDAKGAEPWQPQTGTQWSEVPGELRSWKEWGKPELNTYNGTLWYRTTVTLTTEQASQDAVLSLGVADDVDQTWMNGTVVGNTFGWGLPRTYTIPAEQLKEGENVIVVNVLNTWGSGGLLAAPPERALLAGTGDRLPLDDWQYEKPTDDIGYPPRTPWEPISGLSTLHNAMLAPLHDVRLRGALWYQGESDTDMGEAYEEHLNGLKAQWRDQFGENLPVFVVQLANFGDQPTQPTESGWAAVRDAQRRATQGDPNAGLAVTIDIGTPYNIHPTNKKEIGHRLTHAGLKIVYGHDVPSGSPLPADATREGDAIAIPFQQVEGRLVAYSHDEPIGFELCGAESGCHFADAAIDGTRVLLTAEEVRQPTRVRYCWADSPVCTLYDEAGLPASPFELEISGD